MSKTAAIGYVNCHVCGFVDAEIKKDKNGKAYIFCPDCNIQSFTRYEHQSNHLLKRMRPLQAVTDTVTEKAESKTETKTETPPTKKAGFSLENL